MATVLSLILAGLASFFVVHSPARGQDADVDADTNAAAEEEPEKPTEPGQPKIEVVQPGNFRLRLVMQEAGQTKADIKVTEASSRFFFALGDPRISMTATLKFVEEEGSQVLLDYTFSYNAPLRAKANDANSETATEEARDKTINLSGSLKLQPNKPLAFFSYGTTELSLTLLQTGDFLGTTPNPVPPAPNAPRRRVVLPPVPPPPAPPPASG